MAEKKAEEKKEIVSNKLSTKDDVKKCLAELWFNRLGTTLWSCGMWRMELDLHSMFGLAKKDSDIVAWMDLIMSLIGSKGIWLYQSWTDNRLPEADFIDEYREVRKLFKPKYWMTKTRKEDFRCELFVAWELYIEPVMNLADKVSRFKIASSRNTWKHIENDEILRYFNTDIKNKRTELWIDELHRILYKRDPENHRKGMWYFHGIMYDVLNDLNAAKSNLAYYENGSIPNVVYVVNEEANLSRQELKKQVQEIKKVYKWSDNSGKFLLTDAIKDVKTVSWSPKDMQNIEWRNFNKVKKLSCLRLNEEFVWYSNAVGSEAKLKEMWKQLFLTNIWPKIEFMNEVTNMLIQQHASQFETRLCAVEVRRDSATYDDFQDKLEQHREDFKLWKYSIDEWRTKCGEEPLETERSKKHYIPKNMIALWEQEDVQDE